MDGGIGPFLRHEMWAPQLNETRFTKEEGFWTSNRKGLRDNLS